MYLKDRYFTTKVGFEISSLSLIAAGVPQGAKSSPILFNLFMADQPTTFRTSVADFPDDNIMYFLNDNVITAGYNIQNPLVLILYWYTKCKTKMNHEKSAHWTFILKKQIFSPVTLNSHNIPISITSCYIVLILEQY